MTNVLVIDDDEDIARLLALKLERAGFDVDWRSDGISGLEAIRSSHPHVAILDWMMPGLDGIEVAREARAGADTNDVRLLMLTARSSVADHAIARASGVDDVITKPFNSVELVERVRALCIAS